MIGIRGDFQRNSNKIAILTILLEKQSSDHYRKGIS